MRDQQIIGSPTATILDELSMVVATQSAEGFREVGAKVTVGNSEFVAIAVQPYLRRNGSPSQIVKWRSHCQVCSESYEVKGSRNPAHLSKNCQAHRGTRTQARRGKRAMTELKWARRIINEAAAALVCGQTAKAAELIEGHRRIWGLER